MKNERQIEKIFGPSLNIFAFTCFFPSATFISACMKLIIRPLNTFEYQLINTHRQRHKNNTQEQKKKIHKNLTKNHLHYSFRFKERCSLPSVSFNLCKSNMMAQHDGIIKLVVATYEILNWNISHYVSMKYEPWTMKYDPIQLNITQSLHQTSICMTKPNQTKPNLHLHGLLHPDREPHVSNLQVDFEVQRGCENTTKRSKYCSPPQSSWS